MGDVLLAILILVPVCTALVFIAMTSDARFAELLGRLRSFAVRRPQPVSTAACAGRPGLKKLNCRVRLATEEHKDDRWDVFKVEICGPMPASQDSENVYIEIRTNDITEGTRALPIKSSLKQWQNDDSPAFVYTAELGKLTGSNSTIHDWTCVARIHADWMVLPRRGRRKLWFGASILSRQSGEELAEARCVSMYDNPRFGYLEFDENIQRARSLAVALAFAVGAADEEIYDSEVEIIKSWAKGNIDISQTSDAARQTLEKALNKTAAFFRAGQQIDIRKICCEIVEFVGVAERYDILELCMKVAGASGSASPAEVELLKDLAIWLEVDMNRFRTIMETVLPADMHQSQDVETILGVTSDMGRQEARELLNREFRKWNSRVTSSDPQVQAQADHMLKFIAEAREEYIA